MLRISASSSTTRIVGCVKGAPHCRAIIVHQRDQSGFLHQTTKLDQMASGRRRTFGLVCRDQRCHCPTKSQFWCSGTMAGAGSTPVGAAKAVREIQSGEWVFVGGIACTPTHLLAALAERGKELRGVKMSP
jgi:hypothetical protein